MNNWILTEIQKEENANNKEYEKIFYSVAQKLMSNYQLKIKNSFLDFTEIEIYYYNADKHKDTDVHGHKFQKELSIYFHDKHGRGGVDIGFGVDDNCYGGILIRGVMDDNGYINGPINVSEKFCKMLNSTYNSLTGRNLLDKEISIVNKEKKSDTSTVYVGPRVGLEKESDYLIKNYRFLIDFTSDHKFVEKSLMFLASSNAGLINKMSGYKQETILKSLKSKYIRSSKLYERYNII